MKLTRKQQEENHAALSRARQQERLIAEWAYTKDILRLDNETGNAIVKINRCIQNNPLTKAQFDILIKLKNKAKKKPNHNINIEIFKICNQLNRYYKKQRRNTIKG